MMLVKISNLIYDRLNKFHNSRASLTNALAAGGLSDSPVKEDVDRLSESKARQLKLGLQERENRLLLIGSIEDDLNALGYANTQEAINDAPNKVPDADELVIVLRNLNVFKEIQSSLSPATDRDVIVAQINAAKGFIEKLEEEDGAKKSYKSKLDIIDREPIA